MRRTWFVLPLAAVIMTVAVVLIVAPAGSAGVDRGTGWIVACAFSHRAKNDPIVMPGMTSMSHSHDFFGNTTTDADSTVDTLLGQPTTCSLSQDATAYWAPTLYKGGVAVTPTKVTIYYRTQVDTGVMQPFPSGLKMIAGDPKATGPQPTNIVYYNCHDGLDRHASRPYPCGSSTVDAHVRFPQCWDGVHLDSSDHKSHMAYPTYSHGTRSCPASHPIVVPRLIIQISWPISDGSHVKLASGKTYTLHADFFNAWDQTTLGQLVDQCLNAGIDCGKQKGSTISTTPVR